MIAENCDRDTHFAIRKRLGNVKIGQITEALDRDICIPDQAQSEVLFPKKIVGVYNYEFLSGDVETHQHLVVTADGTVYRRGTNNALIAVPGIQEQVADASIKYVDFATIGGDCYIATGKTRLLVYDGAELFYAGITPPAERPTAVVNATGTDNLNRNYYLQYSYIYKNPVTGRVIESAPVFANEAAVLTAFDNVDWTLTGPPAGIGERVNGYRLYRTSGGVNPEDVANGPFLFLDEIEGVTVGGTDVYNDNKLDQDLGSANLKIPQDPGAIPDAPALVEFFGKMMFLAGFKDNAQRIAYSPLGDFEFFPADQILDLDETSTSQVNMLTVLRATLVTGTDENLYHITGTNPRTVRHVKVREGVGCIARGSVVQAGDAIIRLWRGQFWSWDLLQDRYVSEDIEPLLEGTPVSSLRCGVADVYRKRGHIYCAFPFPSGEIRWTVFSYETPTYETDGGSTTSMPTAWFIYKGRNKKMAATALRKVYDYGTSRQERILWGNELGELFEFDKGFTDDGELIDLHYRSYVLPTAGRGQGDPFSVNMNFRRWIARFDKWAGEVTFGWNYWATYATDSEGDLARQIPILGPGTIAVDEVKETRCRIDMDVNGHAAFIMDFQHSAEGPLRYLGEDFFWRMNPTGLREGRA